MGRSAQDEKVAAPRWLEALPLIYLLVGLAWILGSDLVVSWLYRDDFRAMVYASTLKGALFVVLSATLLYVLLAMRGADYALATRGLEASDLRKPLLAFAAVGLGITAMGYVVYLLEADGIRARVGRQLEASATVAAAEFSLWHDGYLRSMRQVAASPLTARAIAEWQSSRAPLAESLIRERLEAIRSSQKCSGVEVRGLDGETLLGAGSPIEATTELRRFAGEAAAAPHGIARWTAIGAAEPVRQPVIELGVALRDRSVGARRLVAVLVARCDFQWPLAPLPADAESHGAQLILARLTGDTVSVIQPGSGRGAAQYLQLPLDKADPSVVRVLEAAATPLRGRDARGRSVLSTGRPVSGTPWLAVASVDLAGIDQQIHRLMLLIAGMSALGFFAAAALVLPWWRSVRRGADAVVHQAESRADEMAARLGWVTRHANDVILLIDNDGQILDVNDRAEQLYGYTRDELLALKVFALRRPDADHLARARDQFEAVKRGGSLIFETDHVRKDGTTLPVEVSSRQIEIGGQRYVQSIVRDVSERRRAEDKLRESEAQYRLLFSSNPHPMWVYDVETLAILAVNDAAIEHYGYTESEFLGMTIADIRPDEDRDRLGSHVRSHADEVLQHSGTWRHRRRDGSLIDVEITSHSILFMDRDARLVLANDVTRRLAAERAVRASEERYRGLFENASDGIMVIGPDHRVLAANPECQLMLGYSIAELLGIELPALLDASEHARLELVAAASRSGHAPGPATWVHRRKDGSRFTADVRIRRLPGGDMLATLRDLTEIIAARRRIERQRDLYNLLSQCNQAIVKVNDRHTLLQSVARLAVERGRFLFAWIGEVDEAGGIRPTAVHGDDRGYVATLSFSVDPASRGASGPASRALREGRPVIANDFLNDAATACWHDAARRAGIGASAAYPIRAGGRVVAALMLYAADAGVFDAEICATLEEMVADVSYALDAMHARRELEDNRLLLQSLMDAADALVFVFDLEGRAVLMNEACARAMGGSRVSLVGRRREEVMPPEAAHAHAANDRRVIETGEHVVVEERNLESGVERVYLSVKYPLRDVEGRMYAVGGIATDITELRRMQQELAAANQSLEVKVAERTAEAQAARVRAEAADRAKTVFLSSMSHELRSPLHSIIGFTSVLLEGLEGELTPAQQEHLQVVSEASHHLLAIINDLLDMSKIEAGAVALELAPLPISRPVERVVQRFRLQARQKNLELRLEGPGTEVWIDGDERRVEQILSNLVANAIKYTQSGSVIVRWGHEDQRARIDVEDSGPGIAAGDQDRLFQRFSQLKPSHGLVEGAGLGLAIAAGLAEAMGGEIALRSEVGVGSVFSLLLPLAVSQEAK